MFRSLPARLALAAVALLAVHAWSAPGKERKASSSTGSGLVATYTAKGQRVVLVVPTPNFTLQAGESIHPQLGPQFKARWEGVLKVLRRGRYTISVAGTGAASVSVDGDPVAGRQVSLKAGEHPLLIEYIRSPGAARLQLLWESDFFAPEPVPSRVLAHRTLPREYAGQAAIERGRELVEELNCVACHQAPPAAVLLGRRGPDLSQIGSRTSARWIAKWLEDPRQFRPQAVMPVLLEAQERADVAAYLAGLKDPDDELKALPTDKFRAKRGKTLLEATGCLACHGDDGVSLAGMGSKMDAEHLAAYLRDPLTVDPSGRMPNMLLNEEEASLIAEYLVLSRNPAFEGEVAEGNPQRGKELVKTRGCVACHTIDDGGSLKNTLAAPPLAQLGEAEGCLAPEPQGRVPRYHFGKQEREAILAYLKVSDISAAPVQHFYRTVKAFRCTSCHVLHDSSPPDLAELPPPLTGVGGKLRGSWLAAILNDKVRTRPWLKLRMPHFGGDNVGHLVAGFASAAGAEPGDGRWEAPPSPQQVRKGLSLIDIGGRFACFNCHDFPSYEAPGSRGPDMTRMYATLRPEWFRRWMKDPIRIQPNTQMPSFFSAMSRAEADRFILEIWTALSAGQDMPRPAGIAGGGNYNLEVKEEPLVVRTFMPDSGWRSIVVGLPGYLAYCFDAEECRFQYAWSWFGPFIDMGPTWSGRGGSKAKILGKRFYTAPEVYPLRIGRPDGKKPKVKFRGYTVGQEGPVFRYEVNGVPVRERVTAVAKGRGLVRSFEVDSPRKSIWFLAGEVPEGVTYTSQDGSWSGQNLRVPAGSPARFAVTIIVEQTSEAKP